MHGINKRVFKNIIINLYDELKKRHIIVLLVFHLIITFSLAYILKGLNTGLKLDGVKYNLVNNYISFFLSPVKEELKYRLFLGKRNSKYISASISIIIADIIASYIYLGHFLNESHTYYLYYFGLLAILSTVFNLAFNKAFKGEILFLENWSYRNNILTITLSVTFFAFWHGITYSLLQDWNFVYIFIITSISAIFLTIIRIKFGVVTAMFYHILYNTPIFIINNFI